MGDPAPFSGIIHHVGNVLFNRAVNRMSGAVYDSDIESPNHIRFEGPGVHGGGTVQGSACSRPRLRRADLAAAE